MNCAMIFPGYGNQFVGMGKELYDASRIIQEHFEEAAHCLDINFVQVCFASSEQELRRPEYAYPALFLLGSSCFALLQERSVNGQVFTGFDIGGYTALHAAEAISFADGLYITHKLATFYQSCIASKDVMAFRVTGLDEATLQDLCQASSTEDAWVTIGAFENANTYILVGHREIAESLREHINSMRNIKAREYPMEYGGYTPICDDMMHAYKPYLEKIDYREVTHPVIGLDGTPVYSRDGVRNMLLYQLFRAAYFDRMAQQLARYDAVVVPMPDKRLVAYLQEQIPHTSIYSVASMDDIDTIEKKLIHRQEET